jgi:hypothetical protein
VVLVAAREAAETAVGPAEVLEVLAEWVVVG